MLRLKRLLYMVLLNCKSESNELTLDIYPATLNM